MGPEPRFELHRAARAQLIFLEPWGRLPVRHELRFQMETCTHKGFHKLAGVPQNQLDLNRSIRFYEKIFQNKLTFHIFKAVLLLPVFQPEARRQKEQNKYQDGPCTFSSGTGMV